MFNAPALMLYQYSIKHQICSLNDKNLKSKSQISLVLRFDSNSQSDLIVFTWILTVIDLFLMMYGSWGPFVLLWFVPCLWVVPRVCWCIGCRLTVVQFIMLSWPGLAWSDLVWPGLSSHLTACHPHNAWPSIKHTNTHQCCNKRPDFGDK